MTTFSQFSNIYGTGFDKRPIYLDKTLYTHIMPTPLYEFLEHGGSCNYIDGLLRLVNPADYQDVIEEWKPDNYQCPVVFGRTAFADLLVWMGNTVFILNVQYGEWVDLEVNDISDFFNMHLCDSEFIENFFGRSLFLKVRKRLPIPKIDECYTFVPVPALGGSGDAKTVKIEKTIEYLYLLSQIV